MFSGFKGWSGPLDPPQKKKSMLTWEDANPFVFYISHRIIRSHDQLKGLNFCLNQLKLVSLKFESTQLMIQTVYENRDSVQLMIQTVSEGSDSIQLMRFKQKSFDSQ